MIVRRSPVIVRENIQAIPLQFFDIPIDTFPLCRNIIAFQR